LKGFDVVIIGGGLSGSSTALNLSKKGYSVLIIEKEKFQDYKPCAGGMASSMQKFIPLDITDSIESKIKKLNSDGKPQIMYLLILLVNRHFGLSKERNLINYYLMSPLVMECKL